jgi:hypothetical protein
MRFVLRTTVRFSKITTVFNHHSPHQLKASLCLADSDRPSMPYHSEIVGWYVKTIPPQNLLEALLTFQSYDIKGLTPHILSKGLNTYLYLSSTFDGETPTWVG